MKTATDKVERFGFTSYAAILFVVLGLLHPLLFGVALHLQNTYLLYTGREASNKPMH